MRENKIHPLKPRLIILSDLWGKERAGWLIHYTSNLESFFEIKFYDSCELGEVDKSSYTEKNLHSQFLNGGIEKAASNLLRKEKESFYILAFSIGGCIAWKAGLAGLNFKSLLAVSATRLRKETQKPKGSVELIYGEQDEFKPGNEWFQKMKIKKFFIKEQSHDLYMSKEIAELVCFKMIAEIKENINPISVNGSE